MALKKQIKISILLNSNIKIEKYSPHIGYKINYLFKNLIFIEFKKLTKKLLISD